MPEIPAGWGLLAAVVLFVAFLVLKSRISLRGRSPAVAAARKRIAEAKRRARAAGATADTRAAAWREAARIAHDELERPSLAASYAVRAARIDVDDVVAIGLVASALTRARRYRALDKFLWRRLRGPQGPGYERAYDELLALYEGPWRRRERAEALRTMRERTNA